MNHTAISDIFTASVRAEEAVEKIAIVSADYKEFHPDTLKGFVVRIDDVRTTFPTCREADQFAADNADRVFHASSVDNLRFDLIAKKREDAPVDNETVRDDAVKTLRDLMNDEYVPYAIRADIAKYLIESRRIG